MTLVSPVSAVLLFALAFAAAHFLPLLQALDSPVLRLRLSVRWNRAFVPQQHAHPGHDGRALVLGMLALILVAFRPYWTNPLAALASGAAFGLGICLLTTELIRAVMVRRQLAAEAAGEGEDGETESAE